MITIIRMKKRADGIIYGYITDPVEVISGHSEYMKWNVLRDGEYLNGRIVKPTRMTEE